MDIKFFRIYENSDRTNILRIHELVMSYANSHEDVYIRLRKTGSAESFLEFYARLVFPLKDALGLRLQIEVETFDLSFSSSFITTMAEHSVSLTIFTKSLNSMELTSLSNSARELEVWGIKPTINYLIGMDDALSAENTFSGLTIPYNILFLIPEDIDEHTNKLSCIAQTYLRDSYYAYIKDMSHNRILTIDNLASSYYYKKHKASYYTDDTVIIHGNGNIYLKSSLIRGREHPIGSLNDRLSWEELNHSLEKKSLCIENEKCKGCEHSNYCPGRREFFTKIEGVDESPFCNAYKYMFDLLSSELHDEILSLWTKSEHPLPVLSMIKKDDHPFNLQYHFNLALDAIDKGRNKFPWDRFEKKGHNKPLIDRIYLSLTYNCPLRCNHCFAEGGVRHSDEMSSAEITRITEEAIAMNLKKIIFNGGEPLVYKEYDQLLSLLEKVDKRGTMFILRTSLGFPIPEERLIKTAQLFDSIIVSLDGDEKTHDMRRGNGRYRITTGYIEKLIDMGYRKKIMLCAVLSNEELSGIAGTSIRNFSSRHGLSLRINPVQPIGRGVNVCSPTCNIDMSIENALKHHSFVPRNRCGLGSFLDVKPDGSTYPCYAIDTADHFLGNLRNMSLVTLLDAGKLQRYQEYTVDTNHKCRNCDVRYLCGGLCKSWASDVKDIDLIDFDCSQVKGFYERIAKVLEDNRDNLEELFKDEIHII